MLSELIARLCTKPCVGVTSYAELLAHASGALACDVALLDINLGAGEPSGVDAYLWLMENGFRGRIYFFTGYTSTRPLPKAVANVEVLNKPVSRKTLARILG